MSITPRWWTPSEYYPIPGFTGRTVHLPTDVRGLFPWHNHRVNLDEDLCDPCFEIHEVAQEWDIQEGYTSDDGREWVYLSTVISVPVEDLELMEDLVFDDEAENEQYEADPEGSALN